MPSISANQKFLPLNSSREKAKAVSEQAAEAAPVEPVVAEEPATTVFPSEEGFQPDPATIAPEAVPELPPAAEELAPHGLDFDEHHRNLPFIATLQAEALQRSPR